MTKSPFETAVLVGDVGEVGEGVLSGQEVSAVITAIYQVRRRKYCFESLSDIHRSLMSHSIGNKRNESSLFYLSVLVIDKVAFLVWSPKLGGAKGLSHDGADTKMPTGRRKRS